MAPASALFIFHASGRRSISVSPKLRKNSADAKRVDMRNLRPSFKRASLAAVG